MLGTMYVHCTHCGYDNSPEYRFCGMCGASLARTVVDPKPALKEVRQGAGGTNGNTEEKVPVHGPSFLGLSEDPKVEFHYLYEDEQPRSHVGTVVFLLIVLGAAGFLGWQWKHGAFPFNRPASTATNGGQQSASPSEVAPAMTQNGETHIDKPRTGAGDAQPPDQKLQAESGPKESDIPPQANQAAPPGNSSADATQKSAADESKPEQGKTEEAKATPSPTPTHKRAMTPPAGRAPVAKAAPEPKPAPATSPDADLESAGERYLYGNGVAQNCTHAESNLRTAATHGNTKAQTVLGTMYATGHCVGRDLPTAYRWFARALRQEPQNSRVSADLQVLWRQMTPQEKQLATAAGR